MVGKSAVLAPVPDSCAAERKQPKTSLRVYPKGFSFAHANIYYGDVFQNMQSPVLDDNCALFLDIDGTLLDLAPAPNAVVVSSELVPLLLRLTSLLGGALALVSGRPLAQIDSLFAPLRPVCGAEHGAVLRLPGGAVERADVTDAMPSQWLESLNAAQKNWPGVMIEPKTYGAAVHYRQAPARETEIRHLVADLVAHDAAFEMLPAAMALEIRNRKLTKAGPVIRLMGMAPFYGRRPIFVGDDVTDQDGFRAAESLGGTAVDVHAVFGGKPAAVLDWLEEMAPQRGARHGTT